MMKFSSAALCSTFVLLCAVTALSQGALSQAPQSVVATPPQVQALSNSDVVDMLKAGLDPDIVIAKIRHSPVAFDISTQGLVSLKTAGVPQQVVTLMIDRPNGPAPLIPRTDIGQQQPESPGKATLGDCASVFVKAPTEVTRATAEGVISKEHGPIINPSGVGYDAVLVIGVDCGPQRWSAWSGANFCTCEGSMTLESGGNRLWSTTDHERSANAAKAAKKMIERMAEQFAKAWRTSKKSTASGK